MSRVSRHFPAGASGKVPAFEPFATSLDALYNEDQRLVQNIIRPVNSACTTAACAFLIVGFVLPQELPAEWKAGRARNEWKRCTSREGQRKNYTRRKGDNRKIMKTEDGWQEELIRKKKSNNKKLWGYVKAYRACLLVTMISWNYQQYIYSDFVQWIKIYDEKVPNFQLRRSERYKPCSLIFG